MQAMRVFIPAAALIVFSTACAHRPDPVPEPDSGVYRCNGTTVVTVNNQSDGVYYVLARNGAKQLKLGTAIPGVTRLTVEEPVTSVYLAILVDGQPAPPPNKGYLKPRFVTVRDVPSAVALNAACS